MNAADNSSGAVSLVYGTAFEVSSGDPILDHPNVRPYLITDGPSYVGHDTTEILHACSEECAQVLIASTTPEHMSKTENGSYVNQATRETIDVMDFDRGDDPYVTCAQCSVVIYRDDAEYRRQYGRFVGES